MKAGNSNTGKTVGKVHSPAGTVGQDLGSAYNKKSIAAMRPERAGKANTSAKIHTSANPKSY